MGWIDSPVQLMDQVPSSGKLTTHRLSVEICLMMQWNEEYVMSSIELDGTKVQRGWLG